MNERTNDEKIVTVNGSVKVNYKMPKNKLHSISISHIPLNALHCLAFDRISMYLSNKKDLVTH